MKKKVFTENLREQVQSYLPGKIVRDIRVTKANDVQLTGLTISRPDETGGPTYYIDDAYDAFVAGASITELALSIVNTYFALPEVPEPVRDGLHEGFDLTFDAIKAHLSLRLVEKSRNRLYLKDKPYKDVGCDLALLAAIDEGSYAIVITNSIKDEFDYDMEEVFCEAEERARSQAYMNTVSNLLGERGRNLLEEDPLEPDLYTVTNTSGQLGAPVIFIPGIRDKIYDQFGKGYYILPSSIHEMLVLPEGMAEVAALKELVKNANNTVVEPNELVSYNVYHYDKREGMVICGEETA